MKPENSEFVGLVEKSGWKQAEVARRLEMTPADVSRYMNDIHPPDRQTLALFKLILAAENPEALGPAGMLNEAASPSDLEIWRRRAKAAEQRLGELRDGMRDLLTRSSSAVVEPPGQKKPTETTISGKVAAAIGHNALEREGQLGGGSPTSETSPLKTDNTGSPAGGKFQRHSGHRKIPPGPAPK